MPAARHGAALSLAALALLMTTLGTGHACALDGVPSLSANGQLATRNTVVATPATFLTWSPFVFRRPFTRSIAIRLYEDPAKLGDALPPQVLHTRWQWSFGDGQVERARATVIHRYGRAGYYRIVVSAYSARFHKWFAFDTVALTIGG